MTHLPTLLGGPGIFAETIPIARPALPSDGELATPLAEIIASGIITKGRHVCRFEEMVAHHLGVKHAVAVSSCTSGLMLTYRFLGQEGEVVVPSFTFMATVAAVCWAGLRPVFADVNRLTTNIDPAAAEAAITSRTKAIVAVHNSGNPADISGLQSVADRHGLRLIFDAAHAFGSRWQGQPVGSQGDAQIFSTSPTKLLVTGEGGVVATNDDALAEMVRIGREYGNRGDYDSTFPGINARMGEFNALLGQLSLGRLEPAVGHRHELADLYRTRLGKLPGIEFPEVQLGNRSSYKDFSVIVDAGSFGLTRDELATTLRAENIDTRNYFDPPVHRQQAYSKYVLPNTVLENTELLASRILCLPIWSEMDIGVASNICLAVESAHAHAAGLRTALGESVPIG